MGRAFVLLFAVMCVALIAWHPARVAVQTALLLPALFPSAQVDPLSAITSQPAREQRNFAYAAGNIDAELLHPVGGGKHSAVILLLGAGDLPRSDLALHFAAALTRLGVVTLVPESSGMLAERLTFEEIDAIRQSVALLRNEPDVDPERIGIIGLSASGGIAIAAAGQPDLRDEIRFVNSFGSYDEARTLVLAVASGSIEVDGAVRSWIPESRTVEVVGNALEGAGVPTSVRVELLSGTTRARATELLDALPIETTRRLASVSPAAYLTQVKAHVYLMHDVDDSFIPFTESREMVASAPFGLIQRYTEFSIFAHVIPDRPVPWQTFVPDLWRLFWHVHAVLLELL